MWRVLFLASLLTLPVHAISAPPQENVSSAELVKQQALAQEPGACIFTPPAGWSYVDPKALPPLVKLMVIGKGSKELPPSINLAVEETSLTQDEYLNSIKEMHQFDRRTNWSVIGTVTNQGRPVTITQLDTKTKWGDTRMLQAILLHDGVAYVLTATSTKTEFPKFGPEFTKAIRSFTINKTVFEMVPDQERRARLISSYNQIKSSWNTYHNAVTKSLKKASEPEICYTTFEDSDFKALEWRPFQVMVEKDYADLGEQWKDQLYTKINKELLHID
jgi:hypothetical protein